MGGTPNPVRGLCPLHPYLKKLGDTPNPVGDFVPCTSIFELATFLPSAISHVFFGCTACDQFVQDGLAGFGAQYAPKTLDILALGAVSTHDDGDAAIRHIYPFIEYATGDQFGVLPGAEALENRASFLGGSFIGIM